MTARFEGDDSGN